MQGAIMTNYEMMSRLWCLRCNRATKQHYYAVHLFRFLDMSLTVTNVGASIIVLCLSSAYWMVDSKVHESSIWLAIASILVVVTSTVQHILDYRTRWKAHERAGHSYATLNRSFEEAIASKGSQQIFAPLKTQLDHLGETSPTVPFVFWNRPRSLSGKIDRIEDDLNGAQPPGNDVPEN
jgi:hypothetical protein